MKSTGLKKTQAQPSTLLGVDADALIGLRCNGLLGDGAIETPPRDQRHFQLQPPPDSAFVRQIGLPELRLEIGLLGNDCESLKQPGAEGSEYEHPPVHEDD